MEVNFLGFKIYATGLGPTDEFIEVIKSFPQPKNLTEMRSWLGTINQVSYIFATSKHMEPFRTLLSSKLPFAWSDQLTKAFTESKEEIIRQCEIGVRKFELNRQTALATDWCRSSVGCWLAQKFCQCESQLPGCCATGWQTVHVSSKFNSPAVAGYHPIEGEAYAAAWGLEKCKLFTLGNPHLLLAVDHKPLLAILGQEQEMSEVMNPRLTNFKLKSMAYQFRPMYIPGKDHVIPDTLSRRNDSPMLDIEKPSRQPPLSNNVLPDYESTFGPPSWIANPTVSAVELEQIDMLYKATASANINALASTAPDADIKVVTWEILNQEAGICPQYVKLYTAVANGDKEAFQSPDLKPYAKLSHEFTTLDIVVMLQNRVVIPSTLRADVLKFLHSGHAGAQTMLSRAVQTVYWPNYRADIQEVRDQCESCNVHCPSNPPLVPTDTPDLPTYPFQVVCTDFMDFNGNSYMILVDKYSNWLSILKLSKNDSKHVIEALRKYFTVFGVAEVLCSDGATVYDSTEMRQFCSTWGIVHRVSSAYHPVSNRRAEIAVKSAKRLIRDAVGPSGSLNTNRFTQALLNHRNTPDAMSKVSPAQIVFGREIRDVLPRKSYNPVRPWSEMADARESSFLKRHYSYSEQQRPQRKLSELAPGDTVYIHDQHGPTPRKWNKSGTVIESLPYNSYLIKVDGSNRLTKRNRQFLRQFRPFNSQPVAGMSTVVPNSIVDSQSSPPVAFSSEDHMLLDSRNHLFQDAPFTIAMIKMLLEPEAPPNSALRDPDFPVGASRDPSKPGQNPSFGMPKLLGQDGGI